MAGGAPDIRDYFAEMYVAALLGDAGCNVYFPRRDNGFDMIVSFNADNKPVIRPIQVKGHYPTAEKTNKVTYGYRGRLSLVHPDMVLALVFFDVDQGTPAPHHVAWMPFEKVVKTVKGYRCEPASFKDGKAVPRRDHRSYFDKVGLDRLLSDNF